MLVFEKVLVRTKCALCGNEESYETILDLEPDFGGTSIFFANSQVCSKCGYPSLKDDEVYCDNEKSESYDFYVNAKHCAKCPLFKSCESSPQAMYPKAFNTSK